MKILLVSDKEEPYIWEYFDRERFKDIDLTISCGDLKAEYLSFLVTMIKAPLFYVPGNHNADYLKNPPEGCEDIDDRVITYNGLRIAGLGGCSYYGGSVYQYTEEQMCKKAKKLAPKIRRMKGLDIFVAHSPAFGIGDGKDMAHRGFRCFLDMMDAYKPKYFVHGHQHLNYKVQARVMRYGETTIVNGYGYHILEY